MARRGSDPFDAHSSSRLRSGGMSVGPGCLGRAALSLSGLFLLAATKFADALTTAVGLRYVPAIYEANPLADTAFQRLGVIEGLIWSSFVVVVAIALITEAAAIAVATRRSDGHLAVMVRVVGYGIPALIFAAVAIYNVQVLLAGIDAMGW